MIRQKLRETLVEAGIGLSAPRLAIAEFVLYSDQHPTADEVFTQVEKKMPMLSLATVYNTLQLFVQRGLLKPLQDHESRAIRYDCNMQPHFHFIDKKTGRMIDIMPHQIKIEPCDELRRQGLEIQEIEVSLRGLISPDTKTLKENKR